MSSVTLYVNLRGVHIVTYRSANVGFQQPLERGEDRLKMLVKSFTTWSVHALVTMAMAAGYHPTLSLVGLEPV